MNEHAIKRSMKADGYSEEYIERITDDLADYRLQEQRDRESAEALDRRDKLKLYVVLYRIESIMSPVDAPFGFVCHAEDTDHAEEQCINAYPDCDVVWIDEGEDCLLALRNYYEEGIRP